MGNFCSVIMELTTINSLKAELAQKNREIEGLHKMAEDTNEWMEQDNLDREKLQLLNDNLTGKLAILEAKYKESLETEIQLKKENSDLRQKFLLKDKNMNWQTMEKIQKENSDLNVKLCESVQVLEQANAEHDKLKKKVTGLQNDAKENEKRQSEVTKEQKIQLQKLFQTLEEQKCEIEHLNQDNLKLQSELFSSEKPQEIDDEKFVQLQEENTELHGLITSLRLREERVNADKKDCEDVLKLNEMLNKSLETKNAKIAECQEINRILDETLMMLRKDLQSQLMLQKKYKKLKKHLKDTK